MTDIPFVANVPIMFAIFVVLLFVFKWFLVDKLKQNILQTTLKKYNLNTIYHVNGSKKPGT